MSKKNETDFEKLNQNAEIFVRIKKEKPNWWKLFCDDGDLYIDIRKGNTINIYYNGGSVAKIKFTKGKFSAKIHRKYLTEKNKCGYDDLCLETLDKITLDFIKKNIRDVYSDEKEGSEKPAEKWIQCKLILENRKENRKENGKKNGNYIDSEFQYNNKNTGINLRIDLIELSDNKLSFVELKRIDDTRLLNDKKRNTDTEEIITQMKTYRTFIKGHQNNLKTYYQKLIQIKVDLGLLSEQNVDFSINEIPKLLIANTYKKQGKRRKDRINAIENLLNMHDIEYKIESF